MTRVDDVEAAHVLAIRTDQARVILDCGPRAKPDLALVPNWRELADAPGMGVTGAVGYATGPDTADRVCYDCADAGQRAELLTAPKFVAYLSSDRSRVTTWTGGTLGRVTRYSESRPRWGANGPYRRCYVRVVDVHGQHWTGTGPVENGDYVSLRRVAG